VAKPFEEIVEEHGRTVLRVCRALLGSHDADDAWSETFLAAMRAYPNLPAGSNIEAWLVTIAKRKAIDQHRRRSTRPVPVEDIPEQASREDVADRDDDLWEAIEALPRKQRDAVALHYLAGLPYQEVAEVLGNNEAAARRAAADGIKRLRSTYAGRVATPAS
jgi:RNA polymerase sigma factor (sigma-70 family)